jgi:hypothetical protein
VRERADQLPGRPGGDVLKERATFSIAWSRRRNIDALQRRLPNARVSADPDPETVGSWKCERLAWQNWGGGDYHVVLEDDVILCPFFEQAVNAALAYAGESIVSFWANRKEIEAGREQALSWMRYRGKFYGTLAVAMPVGWIDAFVNWGDQGWLKYGATGVDWRMREFAQVFGIPIYMTVPSLVEHGAPSDSLLPHSNRTRVARWFCDFDARLIDWTKGAPIYDRYGPRAA